MIIIKYTKRHLNSLLFGGFYISLMALLVFVLTSPTLFVILYYWPVYLIQVFWLFLGIKTFVKFYKRRKYGYLQIIENEIVIFHETRAVIGFISIKKVRKFAGDTIIDYDDRTATIDASKIDKESLIVFNKIVDNISQSLKKENSAYN